MLTWFCFIILIEKKKSIREIIYIFFFRQQQQLVNKYADPSGPIPRAPSDDDVSEEPIVGNPGPRARREVLARSMPKASLRSAPDDEEEQDDEAEGEGEQESNQPAGRRIAMSSTLLEHQPTTTTTTTTLFLNNVTPAAVAAAGVVNESGLASFNATAEENDDVADDIKFVKLIYVFLNWAFLW